MNWYIKALKKYAVFSGRAGRKEYSYFSLFTFLFSVLFAIIDGIIDFAVGNFVPEAGRVPLGTIYGFAILLPSIAVTIRRLHDTGRSGWWCFITLVPIVGPIIFILFIAQDSDPKDNKYGVNPKKN